MMFKCVMRTALIWVIACSSLWAADSSDWRTLWKHADDRRVTGSYRDAFDTYKKVLVLLEAESRPDQRAVGMVLHFLGFTAAEINRDTEARDYYIRSNAILEAIENVRPASLAIGIRNLAGVQWRLGELGEAEVLFLRAIALVDVPGPGDTSSLAGYLSELGAVYFDQGKLAESEAALLRANELIETFSAAFVPRRVWGHNLIQLGQIQIGRKEYEKAEKSFQNAKFWFDDDSPEVSYCDERIAHIRSQQR
ncbi:tetratricopeptide repeat protein [Uliginosibacterium sp. H1]|nr:tetratricopeptide repeat protein [Uliginosibacterium sp. H1]